MLQLFIHLLRPLVEAIYRDEPSTLQDLLNATGKAINGFVIVVALYSLSLTGLNFGEFLDRIAITKYVPSLTNPWHLLNVISAAVVLRIVGARTLMKIRELTRPLLEEILRDVVRDEVRAEERAEGRAEQATFTQAWLEEQRRAGKVTFHENLEVPVLGANDLSDDCEDEREK